MTLFLLSCSIDRLDEVVLADVNTFQTEYVSSTDLYPNGGYWVYFLTNGEIVNSIFLNNGNDGADGKDGINGIDGIDGTDGVSANIWTEYVTPGTDESYPWGGYWFYTQVGDVIENVFISNGADGINGIDGIDGISSVVRTERVDGGYNLYVAVTQSNGVSSQTVTFIQDAIDGTNGLDGTDGTNGTNGQDGLDGVNGINGINGIDGINGTNGINATIKTVEVEDGYILYITDINGTYEVYIKNGSDGTNGLNGTNGTNGINGIDGINGTNAIIKTEETETGYWLIIINGEDETKIFKIGRAHV